MDNFEIPIGSIINEIMSENRRLTLEASTLRAALTEIKSRVESLSAQVNQNSQATPVSTEDKS